MQDYTDIARKMADGGICKAVVGDYVIYKRKWLYEHLDQEIILAQSAKMAKDLTQVDFDELKAKKQELIKYLRGQNEDT